MQARCACRHDVDGLEHTCTPSFVPSLLLESFSQPAPCGVVYLGNSPVIRVLGRVYCFDITFLEMILLDLLQVGGLVFSVLEIEPGEILINDKVIHPNLVA